MFVPNVSGILPFTKVRINLKLADKVYSLDFLSYTYAYLHDKNPKMFKLGHDASFPIGD